jgi:hypothetical protein
MPTDQTLPWSQFLSDLLVIFIQCEEVIGLHFIFSKVLCIINKWLLKKMSKVPRDPKMGHVKEKYVEILNKVEVQ